MKYIQALTSKCMFSENIVVLFGESNEKLY